MSPGRLYRDVAAAVMEITRAGLAPPELFAQAGEVLKAAAGFTASCWETLDPVTLLPTSGGTENLPKASAPAYFENEYLHEDFNKFDELLAADVPARTLFDATGGQPARSRRYRELLVPNGLGPELRAVLTDGDDCWGAVALIRGIDDDQFTPEATALLARLAPHLGWAVRAALLLHASNGPAGDGPGVVIVDADGTILSMTAAADRWLDLLADDRHRAGRDRLPVSVEAVLARLGLGSDVAPPRARLQASDGTWLVVHGAVLLGQGADQRAIVIEPVAPRELAAVIVRAYGLSRRERQVAELVLRGLATKQVALTLELSVHTVTGYLKSLYAKVGVQSRRELAARFLADHHLPRMFSSTPIAVDGWFADEH